MSGVDDVMTSADAAQRLGVGARRVRALWSSGVLTGQLAAGRLLLDRASVLGVAERVRPASRPLSGRNAWTLLLMLDGQKAPWATASDRSRLRALAFTRDGAELAALVRARARTVRYAGITTAGGQLLGQDDVVPAGTTLAHRWTDLVAGDDTEVYLAEIAERRTVARLQLWSDPAGTIAVHVVTDELSPVLALLGEMPRPVVAVDLLESTEPRTARAGRALWEQAIQEWREQTSPPRARRGSHR